MLYLAFHWLIDYPKVPSVTCPRGWRAMCGTLKPVSGKWRLHLYLPDFTLGVSSLLCKIQGLNGFEVCPFFPVHVEDIILHMFQYIQKLRAEGPQEWVFQECKVILFHQNFSWGKFSENLYIWINLNLRPSETFKVLEVFVVVI